MITPPLGRELDNSRLSCGFSPGDTETSTCPQAATWHIAWDASLENGFACDEHMIGAQRYAYLDRHPIGDGCALPDRVWFFEEKRCGHPGEGTEQNRTEALTAAGSRR